jgi:hypothetical protein
MADADRDPAASTRAPRRLAPSAQARRNAIVGRNWAQLRTRRTTVLRTIVQ